MPDTHEHPVLPAEGQTAPLDSVPSATSRPRLAARPRPRPAASRKAASVSSGRYPAGAPVYMAAGWDGVLPILPGAKKPRVSGYHGKRQRGRYPSAAKVQGWARLNENKDANLALRLPETVLGLDIDAYAGKTGASALEEAERRWGPLPATWRSTSRTDDPISGIRWFKVEAGLWWLDLKRALNKADGLRTNAPEAWVDVETIWWGNRYAVVWPSVHPEGREYIWVNPAGEISEGVPGPTDFPSLPEAWVAGLTREPDAEPVDLPKPVSPQPTSSSSTSNRQAAWAEAGIEARLDDIKNASGNRNDALNEHALRVWRLWLTGHTSLTETEIERRLLDALSSTGYLSSDGQQAALNTIRSAKDGAMRYGHAPEPATAPATPPARQPDGGFRKPFDIADRLTNPPEPVDRFGDGQILYRRTVHTLAGEPESGKSVLAYGWMLDEMLTGRGVMLIDEEAGPDDVFAKFRALGAADSLLVDHLTYFEPDGWDLLAPETVNQLLTLVTEREISLVLIDSTAAALTNSQLDEDKAKDVTRFYKQVLLRLAQEGACSVITLDHMTKSGMNNRYARGSGAKLAATEVGLFVEVVEPFSQVSSGLLRVTCTKDRRGQYGRNARWDVAVDTDAGIDLGFRQHTSGELPPMRERTSRGQNPGKDRQCREALVSFLRQPRGAGASVRAIYAEAQTQGAGSRQVVDRVLQSMVSAGDLRIEVAGQSKRHFLNDQSVLEVGP